MAPRKAAAAQWWAVVDAEGNLLSEGSVLDLQPGQSKVKVDGPSDGRPWEPQAKAWGAIPDPPTPEPPPVDPVQAVIAAIGAIAAQDGPTLDEKLAAIVAVLAQNAPPTEGA
jgi:hypothetical protein